MNSLNSFMVTKEWVHQFKTGRGGWNRVQLAAIGVKWPPVAGWIDEVEGSVIPPEHKRIFETTKQEKMSAKRRRVEADQLLRGLRIWRGDK